MLCTFQHPPEAEARFFIASDRSVWSGYMLFDLALPD
jgi:hypothetical protein